MEKTALGIVFAVLVLGMGSAHAQGNLTVLGTSMAPAFINTNTSTALLNITLNATVGTVTVSAVNITIMNLALGNVSVVEIRNATGSVLASSATFNATHNKTTLTLSSFTVGTDANTSLVVAVSLKLTALIRGNISVNVSAGAEFGIDSGSNVSIIGSSLQSASSQVQDVHSTAAIAPLIVDTSVINQSFIAVLAATSRDTFNNVFLSIPVAYTIMNVSEVRQGSSVLYNNTMSIVTVSFNTSAGTINVTNTASGGFSLAGDVVINFTVNTSASAVSAMPFNITIGGSNLTGVVPNISNAATTVTTQQLVNVTTILGTKNAALANGTDYWEFNITLNMTANVTGTLQYRMAVWNNSIGQTISLTNGSGGALATLRDSANSSRALNVSSDYVPGITLTGCCSAGQLVTVILRMIIPAGTPASTSWYTTYGLLFRSS